MKIKTKYDLGDKFHYGKSTLTIDTIRLQDEKDGVYYGGWDNQDGSRFGDFESDFPWDTYMGEKLNGSH